MNSGRRFHADSPSSEQELIQAGSLTIRNPHGDQDHGTLTPFGNNQACHVEHSRIGTPFPFGVRLVHGFFRE
jgi:hypothetical protein